MDVPEKKVDGQRVPLSIVWIEGTLLGQTLSVLNINLIIWNEIWSFWEDQTRLNTEFQSLDRDTHELWSKEISGELKTFKSSDWYYIFSLQFYRTPILRYLGLRGLNKYGKF